VAAGESRANSQSPRRRGSSRAGAALVVEDRRGSGGPAAPRPVPRSRARWPRLPHFA
jgi:hypothetical protein